MNMPTDFCGTRALRHNRFRRRALIETMAVAAVAVIAVSVVFAFAVESVAPETGIRAMAVSLGFVLLAWLVISYFADTWRRMNDHIDSGRERCRRNAAPCRWHG